MGQKFCALKAFDAAIPASAPKREEMKLKRGSIIKMLLGFLLINMLLTLPPLIVLEGEIFI